MNWLLTAVALEALKSEDNFRSGPVTVLGSRFDISNFKRVYIVLEDSSEKSGKDMNPTTPCALMV